MRLLLFSCCAAVATVLFYGCRTAAPLPERLQTHHPPLDRQLRKLVKADSCALSPSEAQQLDAPVYLDARERAEYEVSHLPGARYIGFGSLDTAALSGLEPDTPLVVYCTVGYRSERIAHDLRGMGYTRVYNLYGSLYAWRLAGLPLFDAYGPTHRIHTYNRKWGTFIPDTLGTKVY